MSVVKQIALVAAGCQPWNLDVCAASADRFAYCATLAIYIYQWNASIREYRLESIQSEHKKTITAIAWSPYDVDLLASASSDAVIIVWSVSEKHIVSRLEGCGVAPCSLAWGLPDPAGIAFIGGRGPLNVWNRSEDYGRTRNITSHLEARGFTSDVSLMRCHPKQTDKIALGHVDGSISIFGNNQKALKHVLRPDESSIVNNATDKVLSIEWDPLSTDYLLFTTCNNTIFLIEALTANIIMCFELPSAAASVHSLSWIHTAPGMFLTGDANTGILRLWNVSKSTPIENFRLKKTGFRTLLVLPMLSGSAVSNCLKEGAGDCRTSSSSDQLLSTSSSSSSVAFIVPPGQVLCTFLDGGVGVYDLAHRKWNFLRELGHIETIFDCQFHPEDPDILATGSFDGTIKIWDMSSLKPVFTSAGNEGVIYSLSWAPADLHCIAASTSKFGVFVLDIDKGKIVRRFNEHGDSSVYTVDWNHKDARRIATTGADHYCIIRHFDGSSVVKYRHPDIVYGCDWSPHNADIIATGCADKCVRVYYLATNIDKELKTFSGHTAKVFRVKWCPLREGILVSGSDDCTVRMWDYTQEGGAIRIFQGHVGPVRGLLWNPEVPYLLMSGSWDSTIRVWDTRDGACLDTILDHGADVYGLACHPQRPFLVVSCSRDSTFRLWSLTHHVQPIEINILCSRPWNEILVSPVSGKEHAMALGTPPLLAGRASRDIKLQLDRMYTPSEARQQALLLFSKLFASPLGSNNLWQLVNVSLGQKAFQLSADYGKGIVHSRHLTQYKAAAAQELEMVKLSKFGAGLGAPSRDEQLRDAADLHVKLGNMQRYCELMIELGQWDKALALAPSVSVDYWSSLVSRRATGLVAADSTDALPYCVGSGNVPLTLQYLISRGQHLDALLVAAAADEGSIIPTSCLATHCDSAISDKQLDSNYVQETSDQLADWYFFNGAPIQSACCHLAVDNHKKAVCKLIRGGELELAIGVGLVLKTVDEQLKVALELLSRRCEKIGRWDLGVVLLQMVPGTEKAVAQLCARCAASMCEINSLHQSAGLPSLDDCEVKASEAKCVFDRVMFYILSSSPETGLNIGLSHVKECMSRVDDERWSVADVDDVLMMMASLQTERLQNSKCMRYLPELLVLCAYIGALKAAARQYDSVVPCLLRHTLFLVQRDHADVPLTEQLISDELSVWRVTHPATSCVNRVTMVTADVLGTLSEKQLSIYETLMCKVGCDKRDEMIEAGPDCVSGSQLPSHTDINSSCLSAQRILGPSYFLEDGHSCVSINEAVMWAKVNPFSPLGSGVRINPF